MHQSVSYVFCFVFSLVNTLMHSKLNKSDFMDFKCERLLNDRDHLIPLSSLLLFQFFFFFAVIHLHINGAVNVLIVGQCIGVHSSTPTLTLIFLSTVLLPTVQCNIKIVILHAVPFLSLLLFLPSLVAKFSAHCCVDGFQKWKEMRHVCCFYAETLYDN